MNDWYQLTNELETQTVPVEELARRKIAKIAAKSLPKRRSYVKVALTAALIALLTACGVAAFHFTDWFGTLTDPYAPGSSEDLLASMGTVIDQRQTVDGVTVTLHGALYDGSTFLLSLSVEGLEEERYSSQVDAEACWLYYSRADAERYWTQNHPEHAALYTQQYDQVIGSMLVGIRMRRQFDQERCLLLAEPTLMPAEGREVVLHLENLSVQGQTIAGAMEFVFTPEKKEVSRTVSGAVELTTEDGVLMTVTEVTITPLQIEAAVYGAMDAAGQPPEEIPMIDDIRLSGEAWTWSSKAGAWIGNRGDGYWEGRLSMGHLERIVDPKTVEAVQIGGVWLELSQLQDEE